MVSVALYGRTTQKELRSECKSTMRSSEAPLNVPLNFRQARSIVQLERNRIPKIELQ